MLLQADRHQKKNKKKTHGRTYYIDDITLIFKFWFWRYSDITLILKVESKSIYSHWINGILSTWIRLAWSMKFPRILDVELSMSNWCRSIEDVTIGYNMKNIFFKKSFTKWGGEAIPRPFPKKSKSRISLDQ